MSASQSLYGPLRFPDPEGPNTTLAYQTLCHLLLFLPKGETWHLLPGGRVAERVAGEAGACPGRDQLVE